MANPSTQKLALACGAAGAYVDVTDDLVTDSVTVSWGRTSAFSDTRPGVISFDLVNDTGKYTAGNPYTSLATAVRIGMAVHHIVDGIHFAGTIRSTQPYFIGPQGLAGSSRVRIVCDDMLGVAARTELPSPVEGLVRKAGAYAYWPFNDAVGSSFAAEQSGNGQPNLVVRSGVPPTFGIAPFVGGTETQAQFTGGSGSALDFFGTELDQFTAIPYTANTAGAWGFWFTPLAPPTAASDFFQLEIDFTAAPGQVNFACSSSLVMRGTIDVFGAAIGPAMQIGQTYFFAVTVDVVGANISAAFYQDGVLGTTRTIAHGGATSAAALKPRYVYVRYGNVEATSFNISGLSHTPSLVHGEYLADLTETGRLNVLSASVAGVTLDTIPTNLSTQPIGVASSDGSVLDGINDVIRTEQGYLWSETTGTLLAPVQKLKIRGRDRLPVVDAARIFTISEILNAPEFTTDIENMVYAATARGPVTSQTAFDSSLIPYVGSASDSSEVLLRDPIDLIAWAQDRILRGAIMGVRVLQFTIDALKINRWADVSALRAGDRIRVTNLPLTQLGVDYVDGWLLGGTYSLKYPALHGDDQMLFTFYLQPVLAATGIYDTDRYQSGGDLYVSTSFNASATTISVATIGATFTTSGGDLPLGITIGSEDMNVTAASGATPQVLTVTRGVNGTTAAAHVAGDLVELTTNALYAF